MQLRIHILNVTIAGAVTVMLASANPARSAGSYHEPGYVQALLNGQEDRLTSPDDLQWNTEIIQFKRETGTTSTDEMVDRFLRVREAGPRPDPSAGPEVQKAWSERASRSLVSSYVRRRIFRYHYFIGFAQRLDSACSFLKPEQKADVSAAMEQAVDAFRIGQRSKIEIDALPSDGKLAYSTMRDALFHGHSDADALARMRPCNSPAAAAVTSTLMKLLSPRQIATSEIEHVRQAREREAMVKQTDNVFVGETFMRTGPEQSWFASAFIATPQLTILRIPSVGEEVPGRSIGWFTDESFAEVLTSDKRPMLFVNMEGDSDCSHCRKLMQDFLVSPYFNRLAGRFSAVLLVANPDEQSVVSRMRKALGSVYDPDVVLIQRATASAQARVLFRLEREASADDIAKALERVLPAGYLTSPATGVHKVSTTPPDLCWMAETFELCQARLRRGVHLE